MIPRRLTRRWLPLLATVVMTGCPCNDTRVTRTAYAAMASYSGELTACIVDHSCRALCLAVFELDSDVDLDRCYLTSLDGAAPLAAGSASPDLEGLRGATVKVSYLEHAQCDDGFDIVIDGSGDDSWDDGSTDDGGDDGWNDGGDDGSTDDGSDDGGGDDGGGDDDGGGFAGSGAVLPAPGPTSHAAPAPHAAMHAVH